MNIVSKLHLLTEPSPLRTNARSANACAECSAFKACLAHLFSGHETQQFENLAIVRRGVKRHSVLYRANDRFEMLYAVRFGQFKLLRRDSMGEQRVAQFHMQGDLIGLDAIATGRHNFSVMALENSEVCEIPYAGITKMITNEPSMQRIFFQSMSVALNEQYERSHLLSLPSLDVRFASFLLQLSGRYARLGYSDKSFRLGMTRGDIGSYLGTTIESISRLISRFNAQGAVSIAGRTVELRNRAYLLSMLNSRNDGTTRTLSTGHPSATLGSYGAAQASLFTGAGHRDTTELDFDGQ
jgi:CRP/FNR family transcriptional regulator